MDHKVEDKIGITAKSTQSNWSFGWNKQTPTQTASSKNIVYHNKSNIVFGESNNAPIRASQKKIKEVPHIKQVLYDPKKAGRTTLSFGTEPTDYRKKEQVYKQKKTQSHSKKVIPAQK